MSAILDIGIVLNDVSYVMIQYFKLVKIIKFIYISFNKECLENINLTN